MRHPYPRLVISLPEWVPAFMAASPASLATLEERMRLAISLARENVNHGGGPFGAILVEQRAAGWSPPG